MGIKFDKVDFGSGMKEKIKQEEGDETTESHKKSPATGCVRTLGGR